MIDMNKKYTYKGEPVEILCTDASGDYPVIALVYEERVLCTFTCTGRRHSSGEINLIEVRPSLWVNVYSDNSTVCHATRERADLHEHSNRIACVEVKEGEGL